MIMRPDLRGLVRWEADPERGEPLADPVDEVVVDFVVNDEPRGRAARLPLEAEVHPADHALDRVVEVGVREDDDRVLAAALERDGLDRDRRRALLDRAAPSPRAR